MSHTCSMSRICDVVKAPSHTYAIWSTPASRDEVWETGVSMHSAETQPVLSTANQQHTASRWKSRKVRTAEMSQ